MSFFRLPKFQRIGGSWESFVEFFSGRNRRRPAGGRNRRLMLDPLEERMLLTLSAGNVDDQLVDQTTTELTSTTPGQSTPIPIDTQTSLQIGEQTTNTGKSIAVDHNGDFVVVWSRVDPVLYDSKTMPPMTNPLTKQPYQDNDQIINPSTASYMTDSNIYARYYTNEVQRIVLPQDILNNVAANETDPNKLPHFSLIYGGNGVQKITISAGDPIGNATSQAPANVVGLFALSFDGQTTAAISFNESNWASLDPTLNNAQLMQKALRALGGALADVTVTTVDARDYLVNFGDAARSMSTSLPLISMTDPAWTSGFLPSVDVTWVQQPTSIGATSGLPTLLVSPTDPTQTALSIEQAFAMTAQSYNIGTSNGNLPDQTATVISANPQVTVTPVSTADDPYGLRTFDITFVGDSGKTDQPQLLFDQIQVPDADKNLQSLAISTIDALNVNSITTLKQSSPEFRVNPDEPDNPFTPLPDKYNQVNPAVAMDADGDFVITWESEVPDSVTPGSKTDIFARRYTPQGLENIPYLVISNHSISVLEGDSTQISPPSGSLTSPSPSIKLASRPTTNVTVTITPSGDPDLKVDTDPNTPGYQNTLLFTPGNWNTEQYISITAAVDADNIDGTAQFSVSAAQDGQLPDLFTTQTITATEIDLESLVISSHNVSVPEGGYNSFTVKLPYDPSLLPGNPTSVTVNITKPPASDDGNASFTFSPTSLTFTADIWNQAHTAIITPGNWQIPQTVTVNAAEDPTTPIILTNTINGTATLNFSVVTNLPDPGYLDQQVKLTEIDDDVPSLIVSTNTLPVVEGRNNSFTVRLSTAPASGSVTVHVTKWADSDVNLNLPIDPTTGSPYISYDLTFTTTNPSDPNYWSNPHTVTISDSLDSDSINGTAHFYLSTDGAEYPTQTVTVNEVDVGRFVLSGPALIPETTLTDSYGNTTPGYALTVQEGGTSTFNVTLVGAPANNGTVTATIVPQAGSDPSLSAITQTLTFTSNPNDANYWNRPHAVTIGAGPDADVINGTAVFYLDAPGYTNVPIAVSALDNTATLQSLILSPTQTNTPYRLSINENFSASPITVKLPFAPLSNVTMTITPEAGSDPDLIVITPTSQTLTFTPTNYNVPQSITFHANTDADTSNGAAVFFLDAPGYATQKIIVNEVDNNPALSNPTFTIGYNPTAVGSPLISNGIVLVQEGGTNTFTISLTGTAPPADLTVTLTPRANNAQGLTLDNTSLTFIAPDPNDLTKANDPNYWSRPHTVTVSSALDADMIDGLASFDITATGYSTRTVTLVQNDIFTPYAFLVSPQKTVFVPEGQTNTFTVQLDPNFPPPTGTIVTATIGKQPGGDVDLNIVGSTTLTFNTDTASPNYWANPHTVTIRASQDSDNTDGTAYFSVSSPGMTSQMITAMEIDTNVLDLIISQTAVSVVNGVHNQPSGQFTVSLPVAPTYDLIVNISKQPGGDSSLDTSPISPTTLIFSIDPTSPNYYLNTLRHTVTIEATTNPPDGINGTANFFLSAIGYTVKAVAATEIDPLASPVVVATNSVSVPEGGFSLLTVNLAYKPIGNVTVDVTKRSNLDPNLSDPDLTASTPLFFDTTDPTNPNYWSNPHTLIFYAAQDADKINGTATFDLTASMVTAPGTTKFSPTTVTATEIDDDASGLKVSTDFLPVLEGASNTFTIGLPLDQAPTSDVTVTIAKQAGGDADLSAIPTTLTFTADIWNQAHTAIITPGNWQIPHTVKILANSDADTINGTATFVISATGYLSRTITASEIDKTQGVKPLAAPSDTSLYLPKPATDPYTFRVNTFTANHQFDPSVAMDAAGNFTISWTNEGQFVSYFNNISARRFNSDGTPQFNLVTNNKLEFQVTNNTTVDNEESYAAMSEDGHAVITWTRAHYNNQIPYPYWLVGGAVEAVVYNPDGSVLDAEFNVGGGGYSSAAFDRSNRFIITWSEGATTPADTVAYAINPTNTYAQEFDLQGTVIRPTFRVNSADLLANDTAGSVPRWSGYQGFSAVGMDADGDITITYEGTGPDVYQAAISSSSSAYDVGFLIEHYLAQYQKNGATPAQLATYRAYLENLYSIYNGEANGIMFTQLNTDPQSASGTTTLPNLLVTNRDGVANALRDGNDQRDTLFLDSQARSGGFTLQLTNADVPGPPVNITIAPVYYPNNGPINVEQTRTAIENAIRAITNHLGLSWTRADGTAGTVSVVTVIDPNAGSYSEATTRSGTDWDFTYLDPTFVLNDRVTGVPNRIIYEIDFQGDVHDNSGLSLTYPVQTNDMKKLADPNNPQSTQIDADVPRIVVNTPGTPGTPQHSASIAMMPNGSFVVAWTQDDLYTSTSSGTYAANVQAELADSYPGNVASQSIQYRVFTESTDTAGPEVTRVLGNTPDSYNNAVDKPLSFTAPIKFTAGGLQQIVVDFDEELMAGDPTINPDSVLNPNNFKIFQNGVEILHGISKVEFGMNKAYDLGVSPSPTNKWEAVLTLNQPLPTGVYTIEVLTPAAPTQENPTGQSGIRDRAGNPLYRNGLLLDGENYTLQFAVTVTGSSDPMGTFGVEALVSQSTQYNKVLSQTGNIATEQTNRSVAIDHSGDFAVVWTSYGQDNPTETNGAGVYMRMYDRMNNLLGPSKTGDVLVNTTVVGNQRNATIAMDADGDFVVVWESNKSPESGSGWDIYAQRFNSVGQTVGGEFRINTNYTNDQLAPAVAMDTYGNFVVTWATTGQPNSYFNDIEAQLYDYNGNKIGSEFRVNSQDIPGTNVAPGSTEVHPAVAMGNDGHFAVVWDQITGQATGTGSDTSIYGRLFTSLGQPIAVNGSTVEFRVNVGDANFIADAEHWTQLPATDGSATARTARNPQVSMDTAGNFIVAWESWQDNDVITQPDAVDSYGVYYRRFNPDGTPATPEDHQANLTVTADPNDVPPLFTMGQSAPFAGNQLNPTIAMDADGDYVIAWDGNGAQPDPFFYNNKIIVTGSADGQGIFVRSFHAGYSGQDVREFVNVQSRVNYTAAGNQYFPSIAMTPDGDYVMVWQGNGVGDQHGIFARRYSVQADTAGPMVSALTVVDPNDSTKVIELNPSTPLVYNAGGLASIIVTFDEDMLNNGATGNSVRNPANYRLLRNGVEISNSIVSVQYGLNAADNKYEAVLTLDANSLQPGNQALGSGTYTLQVLAPVMGGQSGVTDAAGNALNLTGYVPNGANYSRQFTVILNTTTTTTDIPITASSSGVQNPHTYPESAHAVAVAPNGNYIAVWTAYDTTLQHDRVYFRIFDANGSPAQLPAIVGGTQVTVPAPVMEITPTADSTLNAFKSDDQRFATVACDAGGDFVITWTDIRNGDADVYARRYDAAATALNAPFRVNTYTTNNQQWSKIAMDSKGNFIVTWSSYGQEDNLGANTGMGWGVYAQRYNLSGNILGSEFHVNISTGGNQQNSSAALSDNGIFAIVWQSDQSGTFDIYGRLWLADGTPFLGNLEGEFVINATTTGNQQYPDVAIDPSFNNIIVTWQSSGQDGSGSGIYMTNLLTLLGGTLASDILVNTTTAGDQMYPSLAMARDGSFAIAWSGTGTQAGQSDPSGYGVFYQAFDGTFDPTTGLPNRVGGETRANITSLGNQWMASIGSDSAGNLVVVYTGVGTSGVGTDVYQYLSSSGFTLTDKSGPVVSGVLLNGTHLTDGSVITPNTQATQLTVDFSEDLTHADTSGQHSVLNPQNWKLLLNNSEILGAVIIDSYGWNSQTRKYEAVITLDGDGIMGGAAAAALQSGTYVLVISDQITNTAGIGLDGDYDGVPGTTSSATGQSGFSVQFIVGSTVQTGAEFLVNSSSTANYQQSISAVGTGFADEENRRAVAIDHSGDFAAVWTSYGQDDPTNPSGAGVYMRMFDRNNNPLTANDVLVNTTVAGNQLDASIAMDASGDFVVVWESNSSTTNGWDIYGRRFNSMGVAIGGEFLINTNTVNDQFDPSVAMDPYGNFVVVWETTGSSTSYSNDIKGQLYDYSGQKIGGEFRVNSQNTPGVGYSAASTQVHPSVAMDNSGNFVVVWDQVVQQLNGYVYDKDIYARRFDSTGNPLISDTNGDNIIDANDTNGQFRVNAANTNFISDWTNRFHLNPGLYAITGEGGKPEEGTATARNAEVVMDANGNFIVAWESLQDNDQIDRPIEGVNSYGIFFRRFNADGTSPFVATATPYDHEANLVITALTQDTPSYPDFTLAQSAPFAGNQVNPSIAMDAHGDYIIAWDGNGATANALYPEQTALDSNFDNQGIFIRSFNTLAGLQASRREYTSPQSSVNITEAGDQQFPSLAMTPDGAYVAVWQGNGVGDQNGIFARRYTTTNDLAGPMVTDYLINGSHVINNIDLSTSVSQMVVVFDKEMATSGDGSVLNPANWKLLKDGAELAGGISNVTFGLNPATNKWEAVVTFDGNGTTANVTSLGTGTYQLVVLNTVRDKAGNQLATTALHPDGTYSPLFNITSSSVEPGQPDTTLPGTLTHPGNPTADYHDTLVNLTQAGRQDSPAVASDPIGEHVVVWVTSSGTGNDDIMFQRYDKYGRKLGTETLVNSYTAGAQVNPDVAIDSAGNFVVTWSGAGADDDSGVYAQRYDTFGKALGTQFRVNQFSQSVQSESSVAMDANGDFVVTWTSYGQDSDKDGIFARRYTNVNNQITAQTEFQVNTTTVDRQDNSDVAMDTNGDFIVVWESDLQDGNSWGIYGQRFNSAGQALGGEFRVNNYTTDKQIDPRVAMDGTGDFDVVWSSFGQDGNGYGVYARRYNAAGAALDANEFLVNTTTPNWQYQPDISADKNGDFVVTYSAFGQEGNITKDYGIYARMYKADGSDSGNGEFRVNSITAGDQVTPSVAMDADGDFVVAWTGPDNDTTGIYSRIVAVNIPYYLPVASLATNGQFYGGAVTITTINNLLNISGTSGNDVFEFTAADSPANWTVKVNGINQTVNSDATGVIFDGLGGNDTVIINGSTSSLTANIWTDHLDVAFGTYTVDAANVETITVNGNGTSDTATVYDSSGNDVLAAGRGFAKLTYAGGSITANGFETVTAQGSTGNDVAYLYTGGNTAATFTASPTNVRVVGDGFDNNVLGYKNVQAYGTRSNGDTATFTDSSGDDVLIASYLGALIRGNSFDNEAWNFRSVTATASTGNDKAYLYGAPGETDAYVANPTSASLTGTAFDINTQGFDKVEGYGDSASESTATLTGSTGDDKLIVSPGGADLTGTGFANSAWSFRHIVITGNGGNDTADLYTAANLSASAGGNTVSATPTAATLSGTGFDRQANNFQSVTAHGSAKDAAYFFDSASGVDAYTANLQSGTVSLSGTGYQNQAQGFSDVQVYATPGGSDTASFTESSGDDKYMGSWYGADMQSAGYNYSAWNFSNVQVQAGTGNDKAYLYAAPTGLSTYVASPTEATLSGSGYLQHVTHFKVVEGYATPGITSTATFYDTTGDENYTATSMGTADMTGNGFNNSAWNFSNITANSSGGHDVANLYDSAGNDQLEADSTHTSLFGATFNNRVNNFEKVTAHSSGGVDKATLDNAFIESGQTNRTPSEYAKVLWLMDFDELWTTQKPNNATPTNQAIDIIMSAYWS